MKKLFTSIFLLLVFIAHTQTIQRMDPPFWWVNMPTNELQIMLYGSEIGGLNAAIDYDGVSIESVERPENSN